MQPITINGHEIKPGSRTTIDLPVGKLYTHTPISMPAHVVHGRRPGPSLFVCAAIHGDEINGVEIIRRLLKLPALKQMHGTLIAVPIVNVHGFINQSRYLPDRRDLNRVFPGSETGSLAARLASIFMREIVANSTHGIDIHTGALHRNNLPQIRANLADPETERLARVFGAPVIISSSLRDGSLREAAGEAGIPMLLYEAGEALRFDEVAIRAGVRGITEVMRALGMLPASRRRAMTIEPVITDATYWIRAASSGILRPMARLGGHVKAGSLLGVISDPFGEKEVQVISPCNGIIIGRTNLPLANEGDALFHIARAKEHEEAAALVEKHNDHPLPESNKPLRPKRPIM